LAHLARSAATLRIAGDDLVPEEISALLGAEPTHAQRKGQELPSKSGVRIAKFGHWRLETKDREPEDLNGQVKELLDQLTTDLEVWQALSKRFEIHLFCGWFMNESNEGVGVSPSTMSLLAARGIELSLDIYAPTTDA
jgi:Domain of unknown function (DUF4279)